VRILLDESVPRRFGEHLPGAEVESVHDRGWAGLKNGELLSAAEEEYDLFVTADQNLQFQQRLPNYALRVVVLAAHSNRLHDLVSLAPQLLERAAALAEGEVIVLRAVPLKPPAT
jgi:predicted nuclease of predicted toxin-antitoxin system